VFIAFTENAINTVCFQKQSRRINKVEINKARATALG
jgi:hypothetical protein